MERFLSKLQGQTVKKEEDRVVWKPLRPGSSDKGMERVCGRFQVQVLMGTKIYLYKKRIE